MCGMPTVSDGRLFFVLAFIPFPRSMSHYLITYTYKTTADAYWLRNSCGLIGAMVGGVSGNLLYFLFLAFIHSRLLITIQIK